MASGNPATQFQPGHKHSPGRRVGSIDLKPRFTRILLLPISREEKKKRIDAVIEQVVNKAMKGDMNAIKELFDRIAGKPGQMVTHKGGVSVKQVILHDPTDSDAKATE